MSLPEQPPRPIHHRIAAGAVILGAAVGLYNPAAARAETVDAAAYAQEYAPQPSALGEVSLRLAAEDSPMGMPNIDNLPGNGSKPRTSPAPSPGRPSGEAPTAAPTTSSSSPAAERPAPAIDVSNLPGNNPRPRATEAPTSAPTPTPAAELPLPAPSAPASAPTPTPPALPPSPGNTVPTSGAPTTTVENRPGTEPTPTPNPLPLPGDKPLPLPNTDPDAKRRATPPTATPPTPEAPAPAPVPAPPAPEQAPPAPPEAAPAPLWVKPAEGRYTSEFGPRWETEHRGIDIANVEGTPIYNLLPGVVFRAGKASGFGRAVYVDNGLVDVYGDGVLHQVITRYGHMYQKSIDEAGIKAGDSIDSGKQIAQIGNNGQSTGPHLHFEILVDGEQVDPVPILNAHGIDIGPLV